VECWGHTRDVCQGEYKGIAGMREISGLMLWRMAVKYREIYSWMMLTTIFLTTIYPQHGVKSAAVRSCNSRLSTANQQRPTNGCKS
jgi:hypothetical protein